MGGNRVLAVSITAQDHLPVSDVAASVALSGTTRRLPVGRVGLIALDEVLDPAGQKRAIGVQLSAVLRPTRPIVVVATKDALSVSNNTPSLLYALS